MKGLSVIIMVVLALVGCVRRETDARLQRVAELVSGSPSDALDSLYTIEYDQLSESDRHLYDFLLVKVSDKAYINHTSDSLILRVLDYESSHRKNGRYEEALYYAGRVYSDLGDYPTAMRFFQDALDALSVDSDNQNLRANIASQYGRLLTSLRLYREAVPYIKMSLETGRQQNDTANVIYDLQLLGGTYMKYGKYDSAQYMLNEAIAINQDKHAYHSAKSSMYLAAIKLKTRQIDSALYYIHNVPDNVKATVRNSALGYAANIYLQANIPDTAYLYAHELMQSADSSLRAQGYHVLLSPQLNSFVEKDSLLKYVADYRMLIESLLDENANQLAINQQNLYNYQLHVRQRESAERSNHFLKIGIIVFLLVIAAMTIVILYFKNKNKAKVIKLHEALENIKTLKKELEESRFPGKINDVPVQNISADISGEISSTDIENKTTEKNLRKKLQEEVLSLYEKASAETSLPDGLLQSSVYLKLQEMINHRKIIPENDLLWDELQKEVLRYSPRFLSNLHLLASGKLNANDLHIALLIKCGFKPSQMMILLGKSNGAIISRRDSLCQKVLDDKMGAKVTNAIIRLL